MSRMIFPALKELGYDTYHHMVQDVTHANQTHGSIARAVLNKQMQAEKDGGLKVIYHRPGSTFRVIADLLNQNAIVGIAGDGMAGAHFVDVPYLGGTMSFPTGPARLAARTGAPIVSVFCLLEGFARHRLIVHPPIECPDDSPEAVERTVRSYAGLMEEYTRAYPWAWWTWRRLDLEKDADGRVRFVVSGPPTQDS